MCVCVGVCVCLKKNWHGKKNLPETLLAECVLEVFVEQKNMKTKRGINSDSEEEEPKKPKKKTKDLLVVFGSHEMVLTHHMHLPAGFTMEKNEGEAVQIITPKRTKANELKSFRARLGRHLRAVGFVCLDDDTKSEDGQFGQLDLGEEYRNSWVRPTVDVNGKNVALDKHTLKSPTDPAVRQQLELIDPFDVV